jgi:GntR family transcriptional regulator, transcriptional repressor for pyruvate dehydrogenase complex
MADAYHPGSMRSGQFGKVARPRSGANRRFVAVAQRLLDSIEQGDVRPGDRLPPDRVIAADLEVSRATVREALLALELLGVVEIRHGSGVYVLDTSAMAGAEMDQSSTAALFEARIAVEPTIARFCAIRMTDERIEEAAASIARARSAVLDGLSYPGFSEPQIDFHVVLAAACDSPVLADIAGRLISVDEHPLWALVNQHAVRTKAQRLQQVAEHTEILKRIKAHDPDGAEKAMRAHLSDLVDALRGR